jgi:hypothetical protein
MNIYLLLCRCKIKFAINLIQNTLLGWKESNQICFSQKRTIEFVIWVSKGNSAVPKYFSIHF